MPLVEQLQNLWYAVLVDMVQKFQFARLHITVAKALHVPLVLDKNECKCSPQCVLFTTFLPSHVAARVTCVTGVEGEQRANPVACKNKATAVLDVTRTKTARAHERGRLTQTAGRLCSVDVLVGGNMDRAAQEIRHAPRFADKPETFLICRQSKKVR